MGHIVIGKAALFAALALFAFSSCAPREQLGARYNLVARVIDGNSAIEIVGHTGTSADARIPSAIQNLPVTAIGDEAFAGGDWVVTDASRPYVSEFIVGHQFASVAIPDSVTHIGWRAFAVNTFASVVIPDSVAVIEHQAFWETPVTRITIGSDVALNGDGGFPFQFAQFYNAQGRRAGTYTYGNDGWSFEPRE